ncbi:MAG: hypothetical protein AAB738_03420 [Patescibacteria group bacterium]|mgnify:FL=1
MGIIYRKANPSQVFIETKTPGYPRKVMVGKGLLPGGNWVGKAAASDRSPRHTYEREIFEEFSFDNPVADPEEMIELFGTGNLGHAPEKRDIKASHPDISTLTTLKHNIAALSTLYPFGLFLQHVPKWVFDSGDPENKTGEYFGAVSVFEIPLPDELWNYLEELQLRYGNLSNEAQTLITSAEEIVARGYYIGWGQDRVLQRHFLRHGMNIATQMPLVAGISSIPIGLPIATYTECFRVFDIEKIPEGIQRPAIA